jgi:hypothetical protein
MAKPTDEEIAVRAYEIWEENNRPDGREVEFWKLAEQQLLDSDRGNLLGIPEPLT